MGSMWPVAGQKLALRETRVWKGAERELRASGGEDSMLSSVSYKVLWAGCY